MSNSSEGEDEAIVIILAVMGAVALVGGIIYTFFTKIASALGDCTVKFQESLIVNGGKFVFGDAAAPAFVEGVKISMWFVGITGLAIVGVTWWWSKKQNTGRYKKTSHQTERMKTGAYIVGSIFALVGIGTALSIISGAQTTCVGGIM